MRNGFSVLNRSLVASSWTARTRRPLQALVASRWSSTDRTWSTPLAKTIASAIDTTGPLSIAAYMRQCLTSPECGYYTTTRDGADPFGRTGDFVTSPEISQIFGELVGIWFLTEWMSQGGQGHGVQLIELGPGRGTLMDDMLRTLKNFKPFVKAIDTVSLVEASPTLRETQRKLLCGDNPFEPTPNGQKSRSKYSNIPIEWVEDIRLLDVQDNTSRMPFFLAHEFFDSLPIHAFQSIVPPPTESSPPLSDILGPKRSSPSGPQWRELVVAKNPNAEVESSDRQTLEFQLSVAKVANPNSLVMPETSPRYKALKNVPDAYIEISPESQKYVQDIVQHIGEGRGGGQKAKGAALIIDYGPQSTIPINSLRGIRHHALVSPFATPGQVDISADVDFTALAEAALDASPNIEVYGPVEQGYFLKALGIEDRAGQLRMAANKNIEKDRLDGGSQSHDGNEDDPQKKKIAEIDSAIKRLTERSAGGMGKIYKAMAIVPESGGKRRPVGFGGDVAV